MTYTDYNQNSNYLLTSPYMNTHLVQIQIYIGSNRISYSRKSYSLTDVARDIGGLTSVLIILL